MPAPNPSDIIDIWRTHFVHNYTPTTAWGNAVSMGLLMPKLRGFWAYGSVDENNDAYDYSGQGRTLTDFNTPTFTNDGLCPTVYFNGTNQYLQRGDEAGIDITGALTVMTWAQFDVAGSVDDVISKWETTGFQRGYLLAKSNTDVFSFYISTDGTAVVSVSSTGITFAAKTWYFMAGRFTPSTNLVLFVNRTKFTNAVGIPASIFNSSEPLEFGRGDRANYLEGSLALSILCASAVPDANIKAFYQHTRAMFGV